jgi:hypothetical protein
MAVVLSLGACSTPQEETPTMPDALAGRNLIPEAPLDEPSPSPTPDLTGTFPPDQGGWAGGGGAAGDTGTCAAPIPPPIARLNVKILFTQANRLVLDATPLVGPDGAYCREIGFTDGRLFCPVRPEGHPERLSCEALRVGSASDTGRTGPTWTANGRPCQGGGQGTYCVNHPDNQYLVYAYGTGTFRACVTGGACGERVVP